MAYELAIACGVTSRRGPSHDHPLHPPRPRLPAPLAQWLDSGRGVVRQVWAGGEVSTTLDFTIPKALWLTSNRQIANRGYRQRIVGDLQQIAWGTAQRDGLRPIEGRVAAHWTVRYPKGVRRDKGEASNAQPTTKALLDGLVKVGLIEDDGPAWIVSEAFERGPNLDRSHDHEIRLVLTPQEVPWI